MDGQDRSLGQSRRPAPEFTSDLDDAHTPDFIAAVTRELVAKLAPESERIGRRIASSRVPSAQQIEELCAALTADRSDQACGLFDALRASETTADTLCLHYIAPAARRLGEAWEADELGFLDVTLGLARLHGFQRQVQPDFIPRGRHRTDLHALFSPVPTETHVLGVVMAAGFFRRAGWSVDMNLDQGADELVRRAASGGYGLLGLSAGCRAVIPELRAILPRLRALPSRPKIVLGGYLLELEPNIAAELDLDGTMTDVTTAPFSCKSMVTTGVGH